MSDNSSKPPPMSFTTLPLPPPSSGLNVYFVSHRKSSFQFPGVLKSLGRFRGLGTFFLGFCVDQ